MIKKFGIFLAAITIFRLVYATILPVAPQEAYYWNYSRHLALSYFDHPPLTAYFIRLTTLLGTYAFTIHLAAIILSVLMSWAVFRLATMLFDDKTAFWSVVAINLTFIYSVGGLVMTPDSPMLLFWTLVMIACIRIDRGDGKYWWLLLGLFLGAGFTAKYPMAFAGLGTFLFFISSNRRIRWFKTVWPYAALLTALIVVSPVLYWNYQNDWASFLFQTQRRAGEMIRFRPDYFFGFVGTIIAVYGIVPIPILIAGISDSVKRVIRTRYSNYALLISFSAPLLIVLVPVSMLSWVKMNWTAPAFIGWFIATAAYYHLKSEKSRLVRSWGKLCIIFLAVMFMITHIVILMPGIYLGRGDFSLGWDRLADRLESIRRDMPEPYFICGYEYKLASEMAFYLEDHPETVSNNIVGEPGLQYNYWSDPDTLVGYNAIFIYDDRNRFDNGDKLGDYFESVSTGEVFTIERGGKKVTDFHIIRCYNYKGVRKVE